MSLTERDRRASAALSGAEDSCLLAAVGRDPACLLDALGQTHQLGALLINLAALWKRRRRVSVCCLSREGPTTLRNLGPTANR